MGVKKIPIPGFCWDQKGTIDAMPPDKLCCVYRFSKDKGNMTHTGVYTGDGYVIHAHGHAKGVVRQKLAAYPWTHFAYRKMAAEQAAKAVAWANGKIGNPYIMGAYKRKCTPAFRKNRAAAYPKSAANIIKYCPVLNKKQATCSGCKYNGKLAFDCAQLTRYAYDSVSLYLPSGATNQYEERIPENAPGVQDLLSKAKPTLRTGSRGK
ncbi:MAG: hypothetical protein JW811_00295 [Clostridiales bacterium]|nr:hypothetical protein [Clostridiales bacterium]